MPTLKSGDTVEIIAPASRCSDLQLAAMKELLVSWQLTCIVNEDIFGTDVLCANTDEARFELLHQALLNTQSKAIFCARGGYGSMRLIPKLMEVSPPEAVKIFVGMSDITALQLYLQQVWGWPTVHAAAAPDRFSAESLSSLKAILFGTVKHVEFTGLVPMNSYALKNQTLQSSITGGNLSIIQAGIATRWQMDARHKIILIEEIGERGYRVDRMLEHLTQAGIFYQAEAIVFADFLDGNEPDNSSKIEPVLQRFAAQCTIPVVRLHGIGHGYNNLPIPLGTETILSLGDKIKLTCCIDSF